LSISSSGENCAISPINAITVDVEDWFHVCGLHREPEVRFRQWRVLQNTEKILSLLAEYDVKSTFFVLGSVAERLPGLVPMIAGAGHEIASHGYSHRLVTRLDPLRFRDEIRRTGDILGSQCGYRPVGYRAPQWSLGNAVSWAFNILLEEGYLYDSSLNPLPFVGSGGGPRVPFVKQAGAGAILEIPPMVTPTYFGNLPTGGGWGFRFFPMGMISGTMKRLNAGGAPAVLYLHPRELDPDGPRLSLNPLKAFAVYGPRSDAGKKLKLLMGCYRFGTLRELVDKWQFA
jgi:polysaccharide deacetylase family protein (PEP-CTERM system associated)